MSWNDEVILLSTKLSTDEVGNQIPEPSEITILCEKKNVSRQEFYEASSNGFKPSLVLNVHPFEYDNESYIKFDGKKYKVIRTYLIDMEHLELTCEQALGKR